MRVLKISALLTLLSIFFMSNAQTKEEVLSEDYKGYIGKDIASFMKHKYIKKYKEYSLSTGKPGLLVGIHIQLTDDISIEVIVYNFSFVKQFDKEYGWDISLVEKEKISRIIFKSVEDKGVILDVKEDVVLKDTGW